MTKREAEVQRFALAMAVIASMLCGESVNGAQAGTAIYPVEFAACRPLPFWYPRGWELALGYSCSTYYGYGPYYGPPAYYAVGRAYSRRYVDHGIHGRPYLRPGWWW